MTIELPPWLGPTVALLICGAAFWKGGFEERVAGGGFLSSLSVTLLLLDNTWPHVQRAIFVADTMLFVVLLVVALRTPKYWPMAGAGFQLLAVMTHIAKMIDTGVGQWAYMTAGVIWTYLLLAALGVGVWNCWRNEGERVSADRVSGKAAPNGPAVRKEP